MEIGFPKRYEVARPDGLPQFNFKDDGKMLASELTKLLISMYKKKEIRGEWRTSLTICNRG